jgi:hypothetical protein
VSDLHEAFDAWLTGGARDDLPRAVALHASACPGCLQAAGALDALTMIDLGAAELPPLRAAAGPADRRRGLVPVTVASIAVLLVIGAGFVAGGMLLRPPDAPRVAVATPTLAEGVLGGQGGPQASTTESATPSASPTPTPTESVEASNAVSTAAPNPTMGGGPPLATPVAPPITPRPTATPSPRPTVGLTPTPQPTPQPTPPVTPVPTPAPTPVPTPACSDTLDNDGDLLTDFPNDPECLSAADDDESVP